ncbi:MBL fold metallo-hydrolase [Simiduia agarivorans]|uniref:Beta-lactamase n=1 Tax=Simiduia agarivorans (strain DSM 21679 / JCM 13881 / BCRC 17597 / SA1) TaxID=1117647 RepID=K4KPB5_SIMAS|nr:MBL fold metallo-hydrolase [Simiduia agarivorans]AFV00872.1 beta-lactamase [Simiduia agarivorans SA1 = DSM 21679]
MAQLAQQLVEFPLTQGALVTLVPGVRRLVAHNAGPMTGPGTNCYILGQQSLTVIDPGPVDERLLDAIQSAGRVAQILVTHTHRDHSPAAMALSARTGAPVLGALIDDDGHQDKFCQPHQALEDGLWIDGGESPVQAVHTPGHVGNHYCFWHPESGLMFTGDHVMQGATVVIIPPSGDMGAYIRSVQKLKAFPVRYLAPGHGHLMADVNNYLDRLVTHRLARESKVIDALAACPAPATLEQLTPMAYDDVDESLYPVAAFSLWAHLRKLQEDQRVEEYCEGHWLYDKARWSLVTQDKDSPT